MCKKLLVLTKSCRSRTDGPALVSNAGHKKVIKSIFYNTIKIVTEFPLNVFLVCLLINDKPVLIHKIVIKPLCHCCDIMIGTMAFQITSLTIVYSTVHSGADQRKHQSSASLAFVRGIHQWPVNSPHKWPVMRKMFLFDDVIKQTHDDTVHWLNRLTHCGLVTPYGDINLGQHWLRQWLVVWQHQTITWTNVDLSSVRSSGIHLRAILQEIPQSSVTEISLKITYLKFCSNFPGANELIFPGLGFCFSTSTRDISGLFIHNKSTAMLMRLSAVCNVWVYFQSYWK